MCLGTLSPTVACTLTLRLNHTARASNHRLLEPLGSRRPVGEDGWNQGQVFVGGCERRPWLASDETDGVGDGGEGGIRTLEGLLALTPLAGVRLRPLGHLSAGRLSSQTARDSTGAPHEWRRSSGKRYPSRLRPSRGMRRGLR